MRIRGGLADEGQSQMEYIGLVVLVAVAVVALMAGPALTKLPNKFHEAVCAVIGRDCGPIPVTLRRDEYYRPDKCLVSESKTQYGAEISVIATVGADIALVRQVMSDGTVKITAIQAGKLGIDVGVGADAQVGKVINAGAEASLGVAIHGGLGKTWAFDSTEEADNFVDGIRKNNRIDASKKAGPLGWIGGNIYDAVDDSDPPPPDITRYKVGVDVWGQATANAGIGMEFGGKGSNGSSPNNNTDENHDEASINPEVGVGVRGEIGGEVVVAKTHQNDDNPDNDTLSRTFQFHVKGKAGASWLGKEKVDINGNGEATPIAVSGGIKGSIKVSRDSSGNIIGLEITKAARVNSETNVTTTKLKVDSAREREVVKGFLVRTARVAGTGAPTGVALPNPAPTTRPDADALPLEHLLYKEASITKAKYKTDKSQWALGAEGKFGVKVGIGVHKMGRKKDLISAEYLGTPTGDERSYVPYTECVQ